MFLTREVRKGHKDLTKKNGENFERNLQTKLILDKMGRNCQENGVRVKGRKDWNKEKFPSKA